MDRRYDLVVLGAGTAGLIASVYATRIGARVALVE
jgi:pyruvate/2-oxoglutarate dehydrogenase complex dihydrolipoamide dehydrogenase (E3) component